MTAVLQKFKIAARAVLERVEDVIVSYAPG